MHLVVRVLFFDHLRYDEELYYDFYCLELQIKAYTMHMRAKKYIKKIPQNKKQEQNNEARGAVVKMGVPRDKSFTHRQPKS